MRAFQSIFGWLRSGPQRRSLARAQATYAESRAEYDAAEASGDTRSMGAAWMLLKAAKNDLIRAEIALRAAQPRRPSRAAKRPSVAVRSQ